MAKNPKPPVEQLRDELIAAADRYVRLRFYGHHEEETAFTQLEVAVTRYMEAKK